MLYFSISPTNFPEVIFAHQFAQKNYHYDFTRANHNIEIAYIKVGVLIVSIKDQEFRAEEGSFLILPHDCNFSIKAVSKEMHIHYTLSLHVRSDITLYPDALQIPAEPEGLVLPVMIPPCAQSGVLFERLNALIEEHHKVYPERKYKCACKAFEFLCDMAAFSKTIDRVKELPAPNVPQIYCKRIKEYVHKNLEQPLTLSDLSVVLDKNSDYLNRIFKAENGITIQQYVNREKVKRCVELMTTKGLTLTQCCEYVGIKDPNYLSRLFKKHMGSSASQFKRNSVYSTFSLVDRDRL